MNMTKRAAQILKDNDMGGYTVPTLNMYPFQWNWDSAFVALGFLTFDLDRAWKEIETLFEGQWRDGFVPHIVFRKDEPSYFPGPTVWQCPHDIPTSGITQPPVAASIVRHLYNSDSTEDYTVRLKSLFPKLLAWHRWFYTCRDPLNKGLVLCVHPWETGRDNSPEWDAPASAVDTSNVGHYERKDLNHADSSMRPLKTDYDRYVALVQYGRSTGWDHKLIGQESPFRVYDVGMSMMFLRANRDLKEIASLIGDEEAAAEIGAWIEKSETGIDYLWDASIGAFCSRDIIADKFSGAVTSTSFLSFYAQIGSDEQSKSLLEHLSRIDERVSHLLPSLDPQHPEFDHLRYWRGPVWAVVNFMAAKGLNESGQIKWANKIQQDTHNLIQQNGFFEAFSSMTGQGTGGDNFSWTAAIWLDWASNELGAE